MSIDVRVESLRFSGAEEAVQVGGSDLIVLIGPNNAGKSVALREIVAFIKQGAEPTVLGEIEVRRQGDEDELLTWLTESGRLAESLPDGRGIVGPETGFL